MDVLAHALWAGMGCAAARRKVDLPPCTVVATVTLAVLPDVAHMLPVAAWVMLGEGAWATLGRYAFAAPGNEPVLPESIALWSHRLHCVGHSAVIALLVTALAWLGLRRLWIPLLGWWSHILIDVFTHSRDYYPAPVLYPFTMRGFDGLAWNRPWFVALNYAALGAVGLWLLTKGRRSS